MRQTKKATRDLYDALERWRAAGPIRLHRERGLMTVTEFAETVGCTFANVTYWEEQGGMPKKHIGAVAKSMGIHPTTLQVAIKKWRESKP